MQYILTQEEYTRLLKKSEQFSLDEITSLTNTNTRLREELQELKDKYAKLLVHGVSTNNERLKEH